MSCPRVGPAASLAMALAASVAWPVHAAGAFDPRTASFSIVFQGETSAYRVMSTFVLPRADLTVEAVNGPPGEYVAASRAGSVRTLAARKWRWTAPDVPGVYPVVFQHASEHDAITLNVFVLVPATAVRDGLLNGYRIGTYPPPLHGRSIYRPPDGFVEVTKANEDARLSPHFTLRQFICKEDAARPYPKYVVVKERLLLKLEAILARVNAGGVRVDTLYVMSAYRTPYYNHAIGDVPYSQHQFGSAADIFVDRAGTGRMDDLNADGIVDVQDAKLLYDEIEAMLAARAARALEGGLGVYRGTPSHPPFVHVDVRGTKARWEG